MKQIDLEKFAESAKIKLSKKELADALDLYERIKADLLNVRDCVCDAPPLHTVCSMVNIMRQDKVSRLISKEELMRYAIEENNGYFQVPKTLD